MIDKSIGPIFKCVVELEENTMRVKGYDKPLMFGMKGTVEICWIFHMDKGVIDEVDLQIREDGASVFSRCTRGQVAAFWGVCSASSCPGGLCSKEPTNRAVKQKAKL